MTELSEAANDYAARGWPVLPLHSWTGTACTCGRDDCSSPAKHPRTANGLKDASTNPDVVAKWWDRWPDANIGLRTGDVFDVLDVDGEPGIESITAFAEANGLELPLDAPTSFTGGGGQHLLFTPTGIGNRAGLLPKVDWRGRNGYIVAPPSLHASGRHYEWLEDGVTDLHPAPDVLRQLVDPPRRTATTAGEIRRLPTGSGDGSPYGTRALEAELDELARAAEGTRNHTLNAVAYNLFQLVAGGELSENAVVGGLQTVASNIGLNEREAAQTIGSARSAGLANPRNAPELRMVSGGHREVPAAVLDTAPDPWDHAEPEDQDDANSALERLRSQLLIGSGIEHLPAPRRLVADLLALDSVAVMYGRPGSGKSFIAIDIALHVATGSWWHGQRITPTNVLYVVAEGAPGTGLRQRAWRLHNHYYDDLDDRIAWLPVPVNLLGVDQYQALAAIAAERQAGLVIIDTLARSMAGGDENGYRDMSRVIEAVEHIRSETGACVLLVHHTGKDQAQGGRGHSSLVGAIGTELEVRNAHDGIVSLHTTKQKDRSDTDPPWRFVLTPQTWACPICAGHGTSDDDCDTCSGSGQIGSAAIAPYTGHHNTNDIERLSSKEAEALEALHSIAVPGGVSRAMWVTAGDETNVSRATIYRAAKRLVERGIVSMTGVGSTARYMPTHQGEE